MADAPFFFKIKLKEDTSGLRSRISLTKKVIIELQAAELQAACDAFYDLKDRGTGIASTFGPTIVFEIDENCPVPKYI